jgi:hypothetical protein
MKTVVIENYKSKYFPYIATWKSGKVIHSDVFVRKEYAIEHMRARFRDCKIIDKTVEKESEVV